MTVVVARVFPSSVHMGFAETTRTVRFTFYLVQVLAMIAMGVELAAAAGARPA